MTVEHNKRLAREFLEASCVGDEQTMRDITTDDFTWWLLPSTPFGGTHAKDDFLAMLKQTFANADGPFTIEFGDFTAEDDRVSVTAQGNVKMKNGKVYDGHYHILFYFRDGKISSGREYFDSALVLDVFAP
ncbi:nuclear transport factor 2 family protein [Altericroceibacterium spongiae]|nr:nuclear transport factor 2 family protein [Altericroceibacterium spongiae]